MRPIDWSKHKMWSAEMIVAERQRLNDAEHPWGRVIEQEIKRRIDLAVAAYAYEIADDPILSDSDFDRLAQTINRALGTCHPVLDEFFQVHFSPMTGMWIHNHPELGRVAELYQQHHKGA